MPLNSFTLLTNSFILVFWLLAKTDNSSAKFTYSLAAVSKLEIDVSTVDNASVPLKFFTVNPDIVPAVNIVPANTIDANFVFIIFPFMFINYFCKLYPLPFNYIYYI